MHNSLRAQTKLLTPQQRFNQIVRWVCGGILVGLNGAYILASCMAKSNDLSNLLIVMVFMAMTLIIAGVGRLMIDAAMPDGTSRLSAAILSGGIFFAVMTFAWPMAGMV